MPPLFDDHRDGDLGILGGGEADEGRVGKFAGLRGAGFGGHRQRVIPQPAVGGAARVVGRLNHALENRVVKAFRKAEIAENLGFRRLHHVGPVIVGGDGLHQLEPGADAAPRDGGAVVGELERRVAVVELPDGSLQRVSGKGGVRVALGAGSLRKLDAGGGAESQCPGVFIQPGNAELPSGVVEKDIAGVAQRIGDGKKAVPAEAGGLIARRIEGVDVLAVDPGFRRDDPLGQSGDAGHRLKAGAGGVNS